jgi:hypothetical protein
MPELTWREMTAPVLVAGERWTHIALSSDGQVLIARLRGSGVPSKVCRLADNVYAELDLAT